MIGPAETVIIVSPRPQCSPRRTLGFSRKQNSLFPRDQSLSAYYYMACSASKVNQILRRDWLLLQSKATHFYAMLTTVNEVDNDRTVLNGFIFHSVSLVCFTAELEE